MIESDPLEIALSSVPNFPFTDLEMSITDIAQKYGHN